MTPTLFGRWQTRILLLGSYGLLVTLFFVWRYEGSYTPLALLGYVIVFGLVWDVLYQWTQRFRWDSDWPPAFQLMAGIIEAAFLWLLIQILGEQLPGVDPLSFGRFAAHYWSVWTVAFLLSQGPMRIWFPRWRFNGGQWL
jgi:hypothetical protein